MRRTCLFALVAIALVPSHARGHSKPTSAIMAYGQLGGLIPVSKLGPHVSVRLGAGYVLPVLAERLAVVADLGYSATTTDDTLVDPRLAGGAGAECSYSVTQRDLNHLGRSSLLASAVQVIGCLQIHPELGRGAQRGSEVEGGICGDTPLAADQLIEP